MKKTIMLSVVALAFSVSQVQANSINSQSLNAQFEFVKASPFHLSIVKGDYETVAKLISLGSDVNEKWNGMTPAMYAARYNQVDILELLIQKGANLNLKCDKGLTAQEYAHAANATKAENLIVETLVKKKR